MNWLKSKKVVAVHSGNFHADDVFSVALITLVNHGRLKIIRTRDQKIIDRADYALDCGYVLDPARLRFDHHQPGGAGARPNGIPYATFGLVWKQYGEQLAGSIEAAKIVDDRLVAQMDADDNAVDLAENALFGIHPYSVSDYIVYRSSSCPDEKRDRLFVELVAWAKSLIEMEIEIARRFKVDHDRVEGIYRATADKRLIVLDQDYSFAGLLSDYPEPLFVVKPSPSINAWKVYAVKQAGKKFKNRLDLPVTWGSKMGEDLARLTGVPDAFYCHHQLYMAIARSREGAIRLAQIALASINK